MCWWLIDWLIDIRGNVALKIRENGLASLILESAAKI